MKRLWLLMLLLLFASLMAACGPSRDTIETRVEGTLIIDEVQVGDRFPPGCDLESEECSQIDPEFSVLTMWLRAADPDEFDNLATAGPHLTTADGTRVAYALKGRHQGRYFVVFTPRASSEGLTLHWADNEPIDLGKYLEE